MRPILSILLLLSLFWSAFAINTVGVVNNITFINSTGDNSFLATATFNDSSGNGSNIQTWFINTTYGTCNSGAGFPNGATYTVTFNCTSPTPGTANVFINATNADGNNNQTSTLSNTYPAVPPTIVMTYPTNGTQFLGLNISCSFLGTANITLFPGSTGKTATATLYLDGIFYGNQTVAPSISGLYNFNFTGLTQSGIYNMSVVVSDSYGTSNSSAWATMGAMGSCPAVTTPAIVSGGKPTNMTIIIMPVIFFGVLLAVFGYPLLKKKETPTFEKFEKKRQKVEEWKGKKKSEETGEEEKEE